LKYFIDEIPCEGSRWDSWRSPSVLVDHSVVKFGRKCLSNIGNFQYLLQHRLHLGMVLSRKVPRTVDQVPSSIG
jgi:hypothetical protein